MHHYATRVLLESALTESAANKLNEPTCFSATKCVFSSAACVCFINSRATLKAPPGRKRDIHWSNETLFWAFTFTLFYGDLCVCTGSTLSLERSHFCQPASGGFYFLLLLLSVLKLPPGFKAALRGGSACCWVTMLSQNYPGNVVLPFGQRTVVRLFYRRVPRQRRPRWSPLEEAFLRDAGWDTKSLSSCQQLIHVSLYMYSSFYEKKMIICQCFFFFLSYM